MNRYEETTVLGRMNTVVPNESWTTGSLGGEPNGGVTPNLTVDMRYSLLRQLELFAPAALWVDRVVTPIWYIIGIIGNTVSAKVWLERRVRSSNSSAVYLATLAIADIVFLLLHILVELKYAWNVDTLSYPVICEIFNMVYMVAQYLSPVLVLGFTVERWISICIPFKKETYCTPQRALKVIILLITLCVLLCVVQAWFWTYMSEYSTCMVRDEALLGNNASIWAIWTWNTEGLIFIIVPIVCLVFNIMVIREVNKMNRKMSTPDTPMMSPDDQNDLNQSHRSKHSHRRKSQSNGQRGGAATTVMLLTVSFYVIFTLIPATLVYSMHLTLPIRNGLLTDDQVKTDPNWQAYYSYLIIRKIIEEICLSHYACNIFIYLITGEYFRQSCRETFRYMKYFYKVKIVNNVNYNRVPGAGAVSRTSYYRTSVSHV